MTSAPDAPHAQPDDPGPRPAGPVAPGPHAGAGGPDPRARPPDPAPDADLRDLDRLDGLSGRGDLAALVGAAPPPEIVVRLRGGDEMVAALPVLLGFHPSDSLVLVGFGGRPTQRVGLTVRVDLPFPDDLDDVCAQAVSALATDRPSGCVAVVVCRGERGGAGPPRRDVAARVQDMLVEAGIQPLAVVWAEGTVPGLSWACYPLPGQRCGCRGAVPDPAPDAVAAATARRGYPVLPDRAAASRLLAADPEPVLRRRALLRERGRAAADGAGIPRASTDAAAAHHAVLRAALDDAAACRLAVDDATVLAMCAAFDHPSVRDDAVRACLGTDAPAAEQLWAALSRAMPSPERAEPAALFAACALLRGDGALASMAARAALDAAPGHRLALCVDEALRDLIGPAAFRRVLERTYGRP